MEKSTTLNKSTPYIIGGIAITAILAGWYFLMYGPAQAQKQLELDLADNDSDPDSEPDTNSGMTANIGTVTTSGSQCNIKGTWGLGNDDFPLRKGSFGCRVLKLQKYLNNADSGNKLSPDGKFGTKTEGATVREDIPSGKVVSKEYFGDFVEGFSGFNGSYQESPMAPLFVSLQGEGNHSENYEGEMVYDSLDTVSTL